MSPTNKSTPSCRPSRNSPPRRLHPTAQRQHNPAPADFKAREHVVQSGEFLSTILEAYNAAFKAEGYPAALPNHKSSRPTPDWTPIAFWFAKSCSYHCQAKSNK